MSLRGAILRACPRTNTAGEVGDRMLIAPDEGSHFEINEEGELSAD